jgi:hypothetical protein
MQGLTFFFVFLLLFRSRFQGCIKSNSSNTQVSIIAATIWFNFCSCISQTGVRIPVGAGLKPPFFSPIFVSDPAPQLGFGPDPPGAIRRWRAAVNIRCLSSQVQPSFSLHCFPFF